MVFVMTISFIFNVDTRVFLRAQLKVRNAMTCLDGTAKYQSVDYAILPQIVQYTFKRHRF